MIVIFFLASSTSLNWKSIIGDELSSDSGWGMRPALISFSINYTRESEFGQHAKTFSSSFSVCLWIQAIHTHTQTHTFLNDIKTVVPSMPVLCFLLTFVILLLVLGQQPTSNKCMYV